MASIKWTKGHSQKTKEGELIVLALERENQRSKEKREGEELFNESAMTHNGVEREKGRKAERQGDR